MKLKLILLTLLILIGLGMNFASYSRGETFSCIYFENGVSEQLGNVSSPRECRVIINQ